MRLGCAMAKSCQHGRAHYSQTQTSLSQKSSFPTKVNPRKSTKLKSKNKMANSATGALSAARMYKANIAGTYVQGKYRWHVCTRQILLARMYKANIASTYVQGKYRWHVCTKQILLTRMYKANIASTTITTAQMIIKSQRVGVAKGNLIQGGLLFW